MWERQLNLYHEDSAYHLHYSCILILHIYYDVPVSFSWFPDKGFKSGGKEKAWEGKSTKELPMGQALIC